MALRKTGGGLDWVRGVPPSAGVPQLRSEIEVCAKDRKTNNDFFATAQELLIDLILFGKFPPYEVDPTVFRVVFRVYEHYEGNDKKCPTHEGPFTCLSGWVSKVMSRVTEAETTDVVEFLSDTVHTIMWSVRCKYHIEATHVHRLAADVLRYRCLCCSCSTDI
ncbi:hypothetical protein HPB47_001443 [Ixodes persulcatus]|uniref:Uncharacterized protein n=1 Tax=Ixodes persulcatus TaxID=34615 RepID=A0AC60PPE5_IXOPE|nr:hypothetical protein HPB47_001443 [Ixodes persulcatus]